MKPPCDLREYREARFHLLDIPVDPLTDRQITQILCGSVEQRRRVFLANMNLHALYCATRSDGMRALLQGPDTLVQIDGMPIVWLGRWKGARIHASSRLTHIDLVPPLLRLCAERGWRVAFLGGRPGDENGNAQALAELAPGLALRVLHGHMDPAHEARVLLELDAFAPQLLLVGMGMPRQEEWIYAAREKLRANLIMPVGGFMDYFAQRASLPPRFLGPLGLEWAWRLAGNPRRLAFRYCVEPLALLGSALFWRRKKRMRPEI